MVEVTSSRWVSYIGWNDVPHLDEKTKDEIRAATPPHLRKVVEFGIPEIGAGAIYPVSLDQVLVKPFEIPVFWKRVFALDVGWRVTAALWAAWDASNDILYFYSEHRREEALPAVHAAAIQARGEWIPGLVDPASRARSQHDGLRLIEMYREYGLDLIPAKNDVEAGLYKVWEMLSQGRIRVFSTLIDFQNEYRVYRRDDKGKVVKVNDHLMDCMRYIVMGYRERASTQPFGGKTVFSESNELIPVTGY